MKRREFIGSTAAMAALAGRAGAQSPDWPPATAADAGFSAARLEKLWEDLLRRKTTHFLVLRRGRKVVERYAPGVTAATKHYTASLAKAIVGGTSLLVAMSDGRIRPVDRAEKFIPAWASDAKKSKITIRQLATHTSGIQDSSVRGIAHGKEPDWQGRFWRREPDPFTVSLREAPVIFEPGTGYEYSNPGMAVLAYAVTASLRGAPQADIRTLLRDRIFRPIGIPDDEWSIGYGQAYDVDGLELHANWGGANFTARATARIGEWMMNHGKWGDKPLIREAVVKLATDYSGMPLPKRTSEKARFNPGSGLCWYTNFDSAWPSVPRDAFAGAGAQQQIMLVIPSLDMVVVRYGNTLSADEDAGFWSDTYRYIFEPLMDAMRHPTKPVAPPYPQSKVIRGVTFGNEIAREAIDSDNWPLTWGDDDSIHTSYGDGFGFKPFIKEKLSMGFARIDGSAKDFRAVNIRSASGERTGDGKAGAKASGMVMIDGTLYMWVRNTGNSQIVWSADRAQTWEWGFKLDRGFGSPAFVNYGKNYAGAIDDYVYSYSQSGPSAYEIDDGIVLARVRRGLIKDRGAWEFFDGTADKPSWSKDISAAKQVLTYKRHCQRVEAIYHPVLKRYLLVVGYGHNGGWGLFEAPRPWGPWSVAYHTEYWGLGGTHGYRLPTKWISKDGRSLALVFSGLIYNGTSYDAFCVREMKLEF
jgi:CubicO group peptidase (beta-lactamase class C family)